MAETDDGFEDYVITTTNPGPSILIATTIFSFSLYLLLPFMVALCNRRDQARGKRKGDDLDNADDDDDSKVLQVGAIVDVWFPNKHSPR